ncbi:MAG: CHASE2 domain-containing protein [Nostoc sp.]|uniref:nSTAND1 domain-containing NTPase n=1 Tax=Nostoc sp. TaxID=1180 RepID=UPI002FF4C146
MNTFEIAIQRQFEEAWPVVVKFRSGDGLTTHAEGRLRLNREDREQLIQLQEDPLAYGTLLGKKLFEGGVLNAFFGARVNPPVRILLSIEVDERDDLRTLNWERLCIPRGNDLEGSWHHLALSQSLPFSLYIPTKINSSFPLLGRDDLRALVLVASPKNSAQFQLAPFDVEETVKGVREALGKIHCDVLADGVEGAIGLPTLDNLYEHLNNLDLNNVKKRYTLLHIVCHGKLMSDTGETYLFWATNDNQLKAVSGKDLVEKLTYLGQTNKLPYLTFLSTCESADPRAEVGLGGLAQRLVRELAMPAVVAMTRKVSIETALQLGENFYQRLTDSGEVDLALQAAASEHISQNDITVPALFSRLGGRPLFSDRLESRDLTHKEINSGIEKFRTLITTRALNVEKLKKSFNAHADTLQEPLQKDDLETRKKKKTALNRLNYLCEQVLEITFDDLALGEEPPKYQAENPFPGLASFADPEYHRFFFGRDELIQELQKLLNRDKFLAVLGPSGSGKSSLVLAGLIPKLQQQNPDLVLASLTPGSEPLEQLKKSESIVSDKSAVFVVDQFEELFTICTDESKRNDFIDKLLDLAQKQKVILTMRIDFLGECTHYRKLSKQIEEHLKIIGPMAANELGIAMKMQADQVDLEFETGLSNAILAEVEGEPGAMPLLQYALRELWIRRRGRWLCYEEYDAIGGVRKAIATIADKFYKARSKNEQEQVRHIFEQLTRIDEDFDPSNQYDKPKDTRRRVERNQLVIANSNLNQTKNLVREIADARLVMTSTNKVTQRDEVELAHEALILHWPKLQEWLTQSRPRLKLQQQIRPTIKRWQESQDDGELLRGGLLERAGEYLKEYPNAFTNQEKEFIEASQALPRRKPKLSTLLITSFAIAAVVSIVRILGIMQPLELAAYDQMMRQKPDEPLDDRILIVGINESDIQNKITGTGEGQGTVRDKPLQKLLENLQQYQPKVIALDIVRDIPADQSTKLGDELKKNNLIGICTGQYENNRGKIVQGVKWPFEIPEEQVEERVGFSNYRQDPIIPVRIQPLINLRNEDSSCPAHNSFSYATARLFLKSDRRYTELPTLKKDNIENQLLIRELTGFAGGYQGNPFGGYEGNPFKDSSYKTLLNYRSYKGDPRKFADEVSLEQVLNNKISKEQIKKKIVVIGIDSEISGDYINTPYGNMAGPIVQAQMVSQIVSRVLDDRRLIWWWPLWADVLWIGIWSSAGGFIVWRFQQSMQWVMGVTSLTSLVGICYVIFAYQSGWIPLVPAIFALIGTAGVIAFKTFRLRQGSSKSKINGAKNPGLMTIGSLTNLFRNRTN